MTPVAKIVYLSALVIGLLAGLWFGYRNASELLQAYGEAKLTTAPSALREFSRQEYARADLEHARAALLSYAGLLEVLEKAKPEKMRKEELSLTYARLALLEDEAQDPQQSRQFMTRARNWHIALEGRDLSDSEMKAALMRFDTQFGLSRSQGGSQ
jgi:hypothetical protein